MNPKEYQNAFPQMPESSVHIVQNTLASLPEKRRALHDRHRIVLLAAAVVLITAVAAAGSGSLLQAMYVKYAMTIPQQAQEAANMEAAIHFQVGPIQIQIEQMLCDGHMAALVQECQPTECILLQDEPLEGGVSADFFAAYSDQGITEEMHWQEAARILQWPVYRIRQTWNAAEAYMENPAQGTIAFSFVSRQQKKTYLFSHIKKLQTAAEKIPLQLNYVVEQIHPKTGETLQEWQTVQNIVIPVQQIQAAATYTGNADTTLLGITVQRAEMQQTAAGLYVVLTCKGSLPRNQQNIDVFTHNIRFFDENGNELTMGMALTCSIDTSAYPNIVFTKSLNGEKLPNALRLTLPNGEITLQRD